MLAVNDAHRRAGTVFLPPQGLLAVASSTPVSVSGTALYNYTEGYGSYLIPAVMIVIIFQTMLMVIAMLTGEEAEQRRKGIHSMRARFLKDMLCIVSGRTFVYVMLYVVFSMFCWDCCRIFSSIPNIGSGWDIVTMMIPFLLATSFFALAVSRWFTDSEAPLLMIAFFSVGLHLPFRRVLPAGTDALVLASGALRLPCGPRSTRFRKIKFNGRQPCRHLASDADAVDASNHIRCVGGVHYKESL